MKHIQTKLLICLLLLLSANKLLAQQEPLNTMYMYNGIAINPAYAGTRNSLSITASHRMQWVSMPGAPTTSSVSAHMPIKLTNLSFGISVISDEIGPVNNFYGTLFGAYKVDLGRTLKLSLGMSVGFYNYEASLDELKPDEDGGSDDILVGYNDWTPNGGAGAYLYDENFYVGLASPKLFKANLSDLRSDAAILKRHYYLSAGYVFDLGNGLAIKPSMLSKYVAGAPWTQDFTAQLFINDKFSLGATYRIKNAVAFMAGYHIANKWMVGYSYGIATTDLGAYNSGSHEIILTYDLRLIRSAVRTPRYFY